MTSTGAVLQATVQDSIARRYKQVANTLGSLRECRRDYRRRNDKYSKAICKDDFVSPEKKVPLESNQRAPDLQSYV